MARKPEILTISEFLGLKGKQKKPVIVYFDKKQWAKLTRGLKPIVLSRSDPGDAAQSLSV